MDFKFSPEDEQLRQEIRRFLERELPTDWNPGGHYHSPEAYDWDLTFKIRKKLAERGWLTMHWPKEYGGQDASPIRTAIFGEEMTYKQAPGKDEFGVRMLAPVLMMYGTEEQKQKYLLPISRGEGRWCQGYSEPGSGSDLASLQTRAVSDGDDYIINGSKIWTSMAHGSENIFVLCRTDADAPKHKGISFILVDLQTPGITVRPIRNMAGTHHFNEVFFDNVRVPKENLVGEENQGWYVAVTLLDFERSSIVYSAHCRRLMDDLVGYVKETKENGKPLSANPRVRNALVDHYIEAQTARLMGYNVAWMQGQGLVPNKEASISKLFGSESVQRAAATGVEIMGLRGQLREGSKWAPLEGMLAEVWMFGFSHTMGGGTSEIQRNVIATRGLGLPRG